MTHYQRGSRIKGAPKEEEESKENTAKTLSLSGVFGIIGV